jgi:hypothetical protein
MSDDSKDAPLAASITPIALGCNGIVEQRRRLFRRMQWSLVTRALSTCTNRSPVPTVLELVLGRKTHHRNELDVATGPAPSYLDRNLVIFGHCHASTLCDSRYQ